MDRARLLRLQALAWQMVIEGKRMNLSDPVDVLARTIWAEDRGGGRTGMEAVAHVILNRVRLGGWWGNTIIEVCLHPWQFSCWNADDPNYSKLAAVTGADPIFVTSLAVAEKAMAGTLGNDITLGADSYFAEGSVVPSWSVGLTPTIQIGAHIFYKTRIAIGEANG